MAPPPTATFLIFFLSIMFLCTAPTYARFLLHHSNANANSNSNSNSNSVMIRLQVPKNASCEQTYGFLPCTTTAVGNVFLILVYGYLMFLAATYLSAGSELLLHILGPGIVGGLFLPVLGALPDAMLILVSGISGSKETAQSQVSVGMGLLAGSTVMLLTTIWGTCIIVGKCDLENSVSIDSKDTKRFSLSGFPSSLFIFTLPSHHLLLDILRF